MNRVFAIFVPFGLGFKYHLQGNENDGNQRFFFVMFWGHIASPDEIPKKIEDSPYVGLCPLPGTSSHHQDFATF